MTPQEDRGSVTLFTVIVVVGLLAMVGLVVDGSAKVRALQRSDRLAAEAARAGGQAIDVAGLMAGDGIRVNRRTAVAEARRYLREAGKAGSAAVVDDGTGLVVTVTDRVDTVFLGLIGINSLVAEGHARVALVDARTGSAP